MPRAQDDVTSGGADQTAGSANPFSEGSDGGASGDGGGSGGGSGHEGRGQGGSNAHGIEQGRTEGARLANADAALATFGDSDEARDSGSHTTLYALGGLGLLAAALAGGFLVYRRRLP